MKQKIRNPHATKCATKKEKIAAYKKDAATLVEAYDISGKKKPLHTVHVDKVEFIKGKWRIQNDISDKVVNIEGTQMVLGDRIPVTALGNPNPYCEYYTVAKDVKWGIYGVEVPSRFQYNRVVAHYTTDNKDYWVTGDNVSRAAVLLALRLYDDYKDVIHAVACRKMNQKKK